MKADTVDLPQIFGMTTRYEVPLFQRPYVWDEQKQWQPLWDDIRTVALRQIDDSPTNDAAPHFLGAIVVDQEVKAGGPAVRGLIDGQQRLTTLQIVVAATRALAVEIGERTTIDQLEALLFIPSFLVKTDSNRLKLLPTNADRLAFEAAVEHDGSLQYPLPKGDSAHILTAYGFFRTAIAEWVNDPSDQAEPEVKLRALATALWSLLRMVIIALEPGDDAQIIFETLNARGTPLLAADLVKNYLFRQIQVAHGLEAAEEAYRRLWAAFDKRYWREEIGQGRARRPRIDVLLTHWLVLRTEDEVSYQAVYGQFRSYADEQKDALGLLADLDSTATIYSRFDEYDPFGPEGTFFHRLDVLETTTFVPVVLRIFGIGGIADPKDRRHALAALESWLVRRMICRKTTKSYSTIALALLKSLSGRQVEANDVVRFLLNLKTESQAWPTDDEVLEALRTSPLYATLTRRRLRMILDAVEASMHDPKVGPYTDRDRLTIEHILPQSWSGDAWPLPDGDDPLRATIERDSAKHRLGNLALVTQPLNSSLSNAPWDSGTVSKRAALTKYNQYLINKDAVESPDWDERRIRERGERLAHKVLAIWPRPEAVTTDSDRSATREVSPANASMGQVPADHEVVQPQEAGVEIPSDVIQLIQHRSEPWLRPLAREFAVQALARRGVRLQVQNSKFDPWYFQVRHPRFSQVVAYAHPRPQEIHIEYRLPADSPAAQEVIRRDGNFYGIVVKVREADQIATAIRTLDEALASEH
jgi:hypothetical protein